MSLFLGLAVSLGICFIAIWFLPAPKYGELRGCTGRALQSVLEEENAARKNKETLPTKA